MNFRGIQAIYIYEMNRSFRTLIQSLVSPVLSTVLYFIVFGAAIGSRMENISNVSYGAFIVPGLIMLTVQMQSVNNASFGIYFPKFISLAKLSNLKKALFTLSKLIDLSIGIILATGLPLLVTRISSPLITLFIILLKLVLASKQPTIFFILFILFKN